MRRRHFDWRSYCPVALIPPIRPSSRCITELVEQRYQPPGATSHFHMPEDVHHVARFAAQPLDGSQSQGAGVMGAGHQR